MGFSRNIKKNIKFSGKGGQAPLFVDFSMFVNSKMVAKRLDRKSINVLAKTGGFTRQAMKRSMRKARKPKGFITTQTESGQTVIIRADGIVRSERGVPIDRERAGRVLASLSRSQWKQIDTGGSKPGEPPRWRTKLLRDKILFGVDPDDLSVVTGPQKLTGRGTIGTPKLLNEGGTQRVVLPNKVEVWATYEPRPYATLGSPAGKAGMQKFLELTGRVPL